MSNILTNNINPRSGNLITIGGVNDRVSVAGTLSYNDVTNIDSVGIITAQSGIHVTGGSVGIGTDNPIRPLDVNSGASSTYIRLTNDTTGTANGDGFEIFVRSTDVEAGLIQRENASLFFRTDDTERMRIDASGRLLVNTATSRTVGGSVTAKLQIEGSGTGTDTTACSVVQNSNDTTGPRFMLAKSRGTSDGSSTLVQSGDQLGMIDFAGADGSDASSSAVRISAVVDAGPASNDMPGRLVVATTENGASSPTERMRITNQGILSVRANTNMQARWGSLDGASFQNSENYTILYGNSASNYILTRACNTADGTPVFDAYVGGSRQIEIEADGSVNSQGDYTNISDQRLKENIVDSSSQWDDIKALRVRNFNFTEASGYPTVTKIGFIAQEVEQVSPGLVKTRSSYTEDGEEIPGTDTKIVKSSVVTTKAIKALQEAMARIETLEQRLTDAGL